MTQGIPRMPVNAPPRMPTPTHIQEQCDYRAARRSLRAHNPTRSQGARSNEGGKGGGRTRGAANYRPREVEVLLDHVEAELPVGAKGWNAVGAKFREWAAISEYPP